MRRTQLATKYGNRGADIKQEKSKVLGDCHDVTALEEIFSGANRMTNWFV